MTKYKYSLLFLSLALCLYVYGCGSDSEKSSDEPESAVVKMAQADSTLQKGPARPGLNSDIGLDTTKMDYYRLVGRLDYDNGNPRRLVIGLDSVDKAPMVTITYDEKGNKAEEFETRGRQRDGRSVKWYPNGNLDAVGYFKENKPVDTSYLYWDNGYLKQILVYQNGLKDGLWEQYSERGVLLKQGIYVDDSLNGEYSGWDDAGRLQYKGFYNDNLMSGKWEKYYASGRIKAETNYEKGKRNGTYIVWDENGFPMAEQYYVNGEKSNWPDSVPHAKAINPPPALIPKALRDSLE